jgi:hypothetical protein
MLKRARGVTIKVATFLDTGQFGCVVGNGWLVVVWVVREVRGVRGVS